MKITTLEKLFLSWLKRQPDGETFKEYETIAKELGCTPGTVKKTVCRLKKIGCIESETFIKYLTDYPYAATSTVPEDVRVKLTTLVRCFLFWLRLEPHGETFEEYKRIAERLACATETVEKMVYRLEKAGYISSEMTIKYLSLCPRPEFHDFHGAVHPPAWTVNFLPMKLTTLERAFLLWLKMAAAQRNVQRIRDHRQKTGVLYCNHTKYGLQTKRS